MGVRWFRFRGGADSDAMLDVCERVRQTAPIDVTYVWFDPGLEYRATREHLRYLEERYGIEIMRMRAKKTVAVCCREYGVPFMSKAVSEFMLRLQRHGFRWEVEPFDVLLERYPGCSSALRWWCDENGNGSRFGISRNRLLKEFIVEHPPTFAISNRCCKYAKKDVARAALNGIHADLNMVGVRKSEGGNRAVTNTCVTRQGEVDTYRPMYWWDDHVRREYKRLFDIRNSDCYERYGLHRTGCVGCPFARNHVAELGVMAMHEPNLCKAALKVFGRAYDYTLAYRDFVRSNDNSDQLSIFDIWGEGSEEGTNLRAL